MGEGGADCHFPPPSGVLGLNFAMTISSGVEESSDAGGLEQRIFQGTNTRRNSARWKR